MVFEENIYFRESHFIQPTDIALAQIETSWLYLWSTYVIGFSRKFFLRAGEGLKVGSSAKNGYFGGSFRVFPCSLCIVVDWYEHEMN